MKKIIYVTLALFVLLFIGYFWVLFFLPLSIPPLPSSTIFLDKNWQEMGEIIYSGSIRHRDTAFAEIPDFYKKSLITLEDRTFWTNNGISVGGIVRSTLHNIQAGKVVEWGTTLSSGLIRNSFWIGESRTTSRKVLEFLYAIRLNHLYSKEQILTEYVNRVNFGSLNYGLKSASKYYFNKEPKNLTKAEQIALLILPKDPKKYDPYKKPKSFQTRFDMVVKTLAKEWIITRPEQQDILTEILSWNVDHENPLPYVVDFLSMNRENFTWKNSLETTFDRELTEKLDTIAKNTLGELAWKNVGDYGIIVAERDRSQMETGLKNPLLRVMIGWANYRESTAWQVNTTLALRQPGSTIKPFTYALAFDKLGFTPETTILDLPVAYKTSEDYAYEPKNYTQNYKGEITLRQALSESVNVPAIKIAEQVGVPTLLKFLQWLWITSLSENAEHYGLGLTLWNGEISLFELLQAYTIFTNGGWYCPFQIFHEPSSPHPNPLLEGEGTKEKVNSPPSFGRGVGGEGLEESGVRCTQKIDKKYTDMIVSILSDRFAKIGDFPLHSALDFENRNVAVKTGTSRNFRDNWAVGFTDHYMIGVWTGNKSGENMKWVTGATGAGEIFRRIVYALEKQEQPQSPLTRSVIKQNYLTITNPLEWSLYKQEPGKDQNKQKIHLHFETNISYDTIIWMLDGAKLSSDFIDPIPGNHTIEVILMKDWEVVKKEKNTFRVEGAQ